MQTSEKLCIMDLSFWLDTTYNEEYMCLKSQRIRPPNNWPRFTVEKGMENDAGIDGGRKTLPFD